MTGRTQKHLRLTALILALVMLLSVGALAQEPAAAGGGYLTGTFRYIHDAGEDLTDTYIYSDNWFAASAYEENAQLRTVSLIAAMASGNSESQTGYENDSANIVSLLTGMGFETIAVNNYYRTKPTAQSAGCCIGQKRLSVDGKDYTLLAIVPRSEGYELEWASNFTVGKSGLHQGFKEARDEVLRFAQQYVRNNGISGALKVWIPGHSRGAAIANLTAGFLVDFPAWLGELAPQDIYAYTFGTPAGIPEGVAVDDANNPVNAVAVYEEFYIGKATKGGGQVEGTEDAVISPKAEKYGCIRNYFSGADFFVRICPNTSDENDGWSFTRYGKDTELPSDWATSEPLSMRYISMLDPLLFASATFGENTDAVFAPKMLSMADGLALVNNPASTVSADSFIKERVSFLTASAVDANGALGREVYADSGYEATLQRILSILYNDEFDTGAILARLNTDPQFISDLVSSALSVYIYYMFEKACALDAAATAPGGLPIVKNFTELEQNLQLIWLGLRMAPDIVKERLAGALEGTDLPEELPDVLIATLADSLGEWMYCADAEEMLALSSAQVQTFVSANLFPARLSEAKNAVCLLANTLFGNRSSTLELPISIDLYSGAASIEDAIHINLATEELNTAATIFGNIAAFGREHINAALLARMRARDFCYIAAGGEEALTLGCADGAVIRYTTDGSTPTGESAVYADALTVADAETRVKAVAVQGGVIGPVWSFGSANLTGVHHELQKPPAPLSFTDVPPDSFFADAVLWAALKGVTTGTSDTTFSPKDVCTRAQIVTFLWRAFGSPAAASGTSFADVPADTWYTDAVAWAVKSGVTTGTSDTTFSPEDVCTRAQAVTFLWRALACPGASGGIPFDDLSAGAYYVNAVAWAVENGITTGISDTAFGPEEVCTRAQIVTFLWRALA